MKREEKIGAVLWLMLPSLFCYGCVAMYQLSFDINFREMQPINRAGLFALNCFLTFLFGFAIAVNFDE